jgi:hypothetical protein
MIAISQQDAVDVDVTDRGVIVISQESIEFGKEVDIFIQPENLPKLIRALRDARSEITGI